MHHEPAVKAEAIAGDLSSTGLTFRLESYFTEGSRMAQSHSARFSGRVSSEIKYQRSEYLVASAEGHSYIYCKVKP
ncbi:hypothetical protein DPMN_003562 [Dreissena polymorpha]|uniref:Uncharacterized protein n=1 Tax=Dreissena polymorpha TaxID=45954 RepID=A0A9D4MQ48_DREPO|nr:hypothetical protein DPMN_003562 [Dreissena polymorpha]